MSLAHALGRSGVLLVTGPSGAGRSTAMGALEDAGFETIDNLPLSLLPSVAGAPRERPLALGVSARNRDWCADALARALDATDAGVLFLDCAPDALSRRYAETRRRHPLAPDGPPMDGIARERALLEPVRARADLVLDTTAMSPHDLRAALIGRFAEGARPLSVSVESFSVRRGTPGGLDLALDCRFLRNPHWDEGLRPLDGRDRPAADFVQGDPRYGAFFDALHAFVASLLPLWRDEGRAHVAIGIGCTGGRHRSVTVAESLGEALAADGWRVSKRHRELEGQAKAVDGAMDGEPATPADAGAAGTGAIGTGTADDAGAVPAMGVVT